MKLILLDFLRRWKWVYICVGILQFILPFVLPPGTAMIGFVSIIYCGGILLSFDMARGTARRCLILPVTRRELAHCWRVLAILAPLAIFATTLTLATFFRALFHMGAVVSFSQCLLWIVFGLLWLGATFHLLTHMPSAVAALTVNKMKSGIVGGLWGLSIGGGVFFFMKFPQQWDALLPAHWAIMVGALISTMIGWRRAEEMTINRAAPMIPSEDRLPFPQPGQASFKSVSKTGGIPFLLQIVSWNTARMTILYVFIFFAVQVFLRKDSNGDWLAVAAKIIHEPTTVFILAPLIIITGFQWLFGIRHLRSLPISRSSLTAVLSGCFLFPGFVMLAIVTALAAALGVDVFSGPWVGRSLLITAPMLIPAGLILRFGLNSKTYLLILTPMFAAAPLASLLSTRISGSLSLTMCLIGWILGACLIHYSITKRSESYRLPTGWPMRPG